MRDGDLDKIETREEVNRMLQIITLFAAMCAAAASGRHRETVAAAVVAVG